MYKHIVMWKLEEKAEGSSKQENALKLKSRLESLRDTISEIRNIEVGIDTSCSENSFDLVFYSEFDSKESYHRYLDHPDHIKVSKFVGKVRLERIVVDYEV